MTTPPATIQLYVCAADHDPAWQSLLADDHCPICGGPLEVHEYIQAPADPGETPVAGYLEFAGSRGAVEVVYAATAQALLDARHELALLIDAVIDHQKACERKVSKAAWGKANGDLYAVRARLEKPG